MDNFLAILNEVWVNGLLGVSMTKIIFSIAVLLLSFLLRGFVVTVVVSSIERLAKSTESSLDDEILKAVKKPLSYVPVTIGIYIVTMILPLEGVAGDISSNIVKALIIFTIFSALANSIHPIFTAMSSTSWLTESMQIWLERSSRVIVWVIGIAIILELFGIQIGPLVAGLGLFSVAVALGAQDFFKNLISGILIIGENRFQPGDRIEVPGQLHGVVDTIGFRSTIIKTFDTSPMIIPNKDLSDMRLINHGNMEYRRINWVINLIYSTSLEDLEKICDQISNHIKESDDFVDNPNQEHLVTINELGASSIDIGILCYSDVCGFSDFKKIKHRFIKNIIKIVESNKSEFAYPTSSIFVESLPKNSE